MTPIEHSRALCGQYSKFLDESILQWFAGGLRPVTLLIWWSQFPWSQPIHIGGLLMVSVTGRNPPLTAAAAAAGTIARAIGYFQNSGANLALICLTNALATRLLISVLMFDITRQPGEHECSSWSRPKVCWVPAPKDGRPRRVTCPWCWVTGALEHHSARHGRPGCGLRSEDARMLHRCCSGLWHWERLVATAMRSAAGGLRVSLLKSIWHGHWTALEILLKVKSAEHLSISWVAMLQCETHFPCGRSLHSSAVPCSAMIVSYLTGRFARSISYFSAVSLPSSSTVSS